MTNPAEPRSEHPSTYMVQDRSNEDELNRLRVQDQMITSGMGGVLPEQANPGSLRRVLDIGCGSGSWVIEAARTYPDMSLFGADISKLMIDYARGQAIAQGVAERIEFRVMDALRMLEFPANYFDLVNMRLSVSWARTWDWPKLLNEMQRVTRPGGIVRITETELITQSNSSALTQWFEMFQCALFRAGHVFEPATTGITAHLAPLLHQHGVKDAQTRTYMLEYYGGTPQGQAYYEDMQHIFRTVRPFLQKWGCLPSDYAAICQQALNEMQQGDFYAKWTFLTAWGSSPMKQGQRQLYTEQR